MLDTIQAKRDEIYAVAKKHKAEMLWVFGSCARKEETPESDVDLLVKFSSGASLFDQGGLSYSIGRILGRGVDVVDSTALSREPFFSYAVKKDLIAI
jgi:predicted nucleotidyltransferase